MNQSWVSLSRAFLLCLVVQATSVARAQLVADGATNTLSNVTNSITGDVTVGTNGSFTLLVLADNTLLTNSINGIIGRNSTAKSNEVRLISSTSRWRLGGSLFVGSNGVANRLVVSNGALLEDLSGNVGFRQASGNNSALVTGAGSLWTNAGSFSISPGIFASSSNQLVVSDSGALAVGGTAAVGGFGNQVFITGVGSRWANQSDFTFGGGDNRLEVSAGAWLVSSNGNIGDLTGSDSNTVLLTGTGTVWSNSGSLSMGWGGARAVLTASNGAALFVGGRASLGANGGGNSIWVTDPGTACTIGSDLYLGGTAGDNLLTISNGGFVLSSNAFLGSFFAASANSALVTGAGSVWSNRNVLSVGDASINNRLVAANGGTVFTGDAVVGATNGANGNSVLVTDNGTRFLVANNVFVGSNGTLSLLVVSNGAVVSDFDGVLGNNASSSNNAVVVTGPNSTWTNFADFVVGFFGSSNQLTVDNGGVIRCDSGNIGGFGRGNQALVTGPGSLWSFTGDHFFVGGGGSANQLVISNGAVIQDNFAYIGEDFSGSNNLAVVTGSGSVWGNANELAVGDFGPGNRLIVTNGGVVFAGSNLFVGKGLNSTNNQVVVDGGILRATNGAGIATLDVRRGTCVLNSGTMEADLLLLTNTLQGQFQFNGGTLITRGLTRPSITEFVLDGSPASPAIWDVRAGVNTHTLQSLLIVGFNSSINQLLITNGALLTGFMHGVLGWNAGANSNAASISGSGSQWRLGNNNLYLGNAGSNNRLLVSNGGSVSDRNGYLGEVAGSSGNLAWISGSGSVWSNAGSIYVGDFGSANQLVISNAGCVVVGTNGIIGASQATSNNAVLVTDPGSRWFIQQDLYVGSNSPLNRLTIANGAMVTNRNAIVGYWIPPGTPTMSNEVLVTGAGTLWNISNLLAVGWNANSNRLTISNGAVVKSFRCDITESLSTNNTIVVTGPGSALTNRGALIVGANTGGSCRLIVSNAATVESGSATIGAAGDSTNFEASVSGAGSVWVNRGGLVLGPGSYSRLVVTNGGGVVSLGDVLLGVNPATNNRIIVDGGALWVTNIAANALLEIRRGTNILNGGLIEADIVRMTNSPLSILQFNGGTLAAKSSKIYSGTILRLGNGVSPAMMLLAGNGLHDWAGNLLVQVASNAVVTGNGIVVGGITFQNGSTLLPGTSIGKIIFTNSPTLQGSVIMEISKNSAALTNDQVQGIVGTLTYGGTLAVTNIGPSALTAGDRFQLFNASAYAGSFAAITLPPLAPGLAWTNKLLVDGSIEVATGPSFTSISLSGTSLIISGTNGTPNSPYAVLTATNVATPLSNWVSLVTNQFDSSGNYLFTNPITPGELQRYFRIRTP
jgi:T5SS/PEP-CTERM-associated repeat protein